MNPRTHGTEQDTNFQSLPVARASYQQTSTSAFARLQRQNWPSGPATSCRAAPTCPRTPQLVRTSKVSGPPDARARGKISGRGACSAAAQPSPRPPRHRSKRAARSLSSAAQRSGAVLSIGRPSSHLPPPLSRRYRRRRSCRGAGTHTAVGLNRADRHSRSPRGRSTSGMRQPPRRRHTRGGRRERAPLLLHARERSASACMASVRCGARQCARMGDTCTRVVCVCGCFGCCLRSTGRSGMLTQGLAGLDMRGVHLWLAPGEQASRSYQGVHDAARCRWQSCSSSPIRRSRR